MTQLTTAGGQSSGDVSQTNYAPDWLAPNLLGMPQALPFNPWPKQYWEPSKQSITTEVLFSLATAYATPISPSTIQRAGYWYFWEPSSQTLEAQTQVRNSAFLTPGAQVLASYLLLVDHYLTTGYAVAGTIVTEGNQIPFGWTPTLAVDPLNTPAIKAFWNAGPRPIAEAEASREFYPVAGRIFRKPIVHWVPANLTSILTSESGVVLTSDITGQPLTTDTVSPNSFILTGPGASLGVKNV